MIIRKDTHTAVTLTGLRRGKDVVKSYLQILCCGMGQLMLPHIEYADRLCLSPRYLSSVIRNVSGRTVVEWVNQAVILEAKVLLKHSDLLTYQIADELHFPNPSFFSKFFKRMTGMTPQGYQRT